LPCDGGADVPSLVGGDELSVEEVEGINVTGSPPSVATAMCLDLMVNYLHDGPPNYPYIFDCLGDSFRIPKFESFTCEYVCIVISHPSSCFEVWRVVKAPLRLLRLLPVSESLKRMLAV
jgi:hypothetical protein